MPTLEEEVAGLTQATTDLLTTVNVKKSTLDASVDESTTQAAISTAGANTATEQAGIATAAKNAAESARDDAVAVVYSGEASLTPAPGKIPIGRADGRVDPGWFSGIGQIGIAGAQGFGVGIAPIVPAGFAPLSGYTDPASENYGNYQFDDGSIMVFVPKFYYRIGYVGNPTFGAYGVNSVDVKGVEAFKDRAMAEDSGYALHRAFIDGGIEQPGFFFDKFMASANVKGSGVVGSSIKNGDPISTHADHNPIAALTACTSNAYWQALNAAKGRDGVDGAINNESLFFPTSAQQMSALGILTIAHAQASTTTTFNAWYDATNNFPKGYNNNALRDVNDTSVLYVSDGFQNCGKTGSGEPFAKTTHNGQASGIADLNGLMWEINIGVTCVAAARTITGVSQASPAVVTAVGHGFTTGQVAMILSVGGMTALNDKLYRITVLTADTFALDGVDSSALPAYTSAGSATGGTFYVAKEATAMRDFTSGNSSATDHWGATGVAAMMEPIDIPFRTDYPLNGFVLRWGNGAEQVLDADISGEGWRRAGLGVPIAGNALSSGGTNLFGSDYFYQYIRNELCLPSCGHWSGSTSAGVWSRLWSHLRTSASTIAGFRCSCYPL